MEHHSTQEHIGRNAAFLVIFGCLLAALGLITALSPLAAGLSVKFVVSIMLLSRGSMQLYYGIKVRHWGHRLGSYMGLGSIVMSFASVACGIFLLATSWWEVGVVMMVVAGYLVLVGLADVLHALELKEADGWFIIFWNGLAGIALGVMVWLQWPVSGGLAMGGMMGLSMMSSGASLAMLGLMGRTYLINQQVQQSVA